MSMDEIVVTHIYPPIPIRQFDWCATRADYEPGNPIGYGPTREAAIADLVEAEEDRMEGHA